jgi:hypothetical protein
MRKLPLEVEIPGTGQRRHGNAFVQDMAWIEPKAMVEQTPAADHDSMKSFRSGDPEAFTGLYRAHQPAVFRFALHMTGDPVEAADVVQDVFVWPVHHAAAFDPERGPLEAAEIGRACY